MVQVSESFIPRPKELVAVLFCEVKDVVGLVAVEPLDEGEFEGIEPELRGTVVALDVNVRWLESVRHVKEEAKAALA
jgi:hypothetical protein